MSLTIWENARVATMQQGQEANYGLIEDGVIVVEDGAWPGLANVLICHLNTVSVPWYTIHTKHSSRLA